MHSSTAGSSASSSEADENAQQNISKMRKTRSVRETKLYIEIQPHQCPVVYCSGYNISCFGLEKFHPFDAHKWGNIYKFLLESGKLSENAVVRPLEASKEDLKVVHARKYLDSLNYSLKLAAIVEVPFVACIPTCLVNYRLLRPMRLQTGGTILAARLALQHKWAINIGGGYHHASSSHGGGFCIYADISLALNFLFLSNLISTAMIIDLDAHQGNGHETDFLKDRRVYIFDMFNSEIYPHDYKARDGISQIIPLRCGVSDQEYLDELSKELKIAFSKFTPGLIVYNAGTDCLIHDPLGLLRLSPRAVTSRDEMVFQFASHHSIPIVMVTSGGYLKESAGVVADSIINLHKKGLIQLK